VKPISITVVGQDEIKKRIAELGKIYPKAMAGAVYKLGVAILSDALPRTPVEFAVLRTSAYVSPPAGEGAKATVEIGYGTVYAVPQHENLSFKHPRGGEAKFLEKAVNALSPRALKLLAGWAEQLAKTGGQWGSSTGVSTRPVVSNSNQKKPSQGARLKRAAANVRKRTGR
jgi:hypothetical protein